MVTKNKNKSPAKDSRSTKRSHITHTRTEMATVIRVKRRVDEEPLNAFVLNCKKRRFEDIEDDADRTAAKDACAADGTSTTVVKFAGTVQNQVRP